MKSGVGDQCNFYATKYTASPNSVSLPSLGQRAGGNDQAGGLGDGHEVAGDVLVSDSIRTALFHHFRQDENSEKRS